MDFEYIYNLKISSISITYFKNYGFCVPIVIASRPPPPVTSRPGTCYFVLLCVIYILCDIS